eukprot:2009858-Amphidinium_carterae.2
MGQRVCSYTSTSSFQVLDEQSSNFLQWQREEAATVEIDANRLQARVLACTLPRFTHYTNPPHLADTPYCWRLLKAMYGTLAEAGDFQAEVGSRIVEYIGTTPGVSSVCGCVPFAGRGVAAVLHGDDILAQGTGPDLEKFEVSVKAEETDDKPCTLLNRVMLWTETGLVYEADPRHVELILAETGTLHAKELSTPLVRATPEEWAAVQPLKPE